MMMMMMMLLLLMLLCVWLQNAASWFQADFGWQDAFGTIGGIFATIVINALIEFWYSNFFFESKWSSCGFLVHHYVCCWFVCIHLKIPLLS